jgi:hypothetical protein
MTEQPGPFDAEPVSAVRVMPPTKRDPGPLVEEIADVFVRIEIDYYREGAGRAARFEGDRVRRVREADRG